MLTAAQLPRILLHLHGAAVCRDHSRLRSSQGEHPCAFVLHWRQKRPLLVQVRDEFFWRVGVAARHNYGKTCCECIRPEHELTSNTGHPRTDWTIPAQDRQ